MKILLPALSPTMETGNLVKWLVKEGDDVLSGDILAEIETDKATMELESPDDGKIEKILVKEGSENISVNTEIALLSVEGVEIEAKIEKPIDEAIPKTNPIKDFSPPFPIAIINIPIVAIIIDIHTLKEILSLKNKKANNAVKKGIAAKQSKVMAALVFVIE